MLKDIKSQVVKGLNKDYVRKNFIFASACTAHSMQGSSVDTHITIFDYNHPLVRNYPEWLCTSITRCRDLSRVKFFRYNTDINDELNMQNIRSYFNRKVENYKKQDRKSKRVIPKENYVNTQWFLNNITNQCNYCGCGFHISINKGNVITNLTAQRVNNELSHELDNIIPFCTRCNCSCK